MGIRYEDYCVGCPPEMGCLGEHCRNRNVPVWYCDSCEDNDIDLWDYDGQELCKDCLLKEIPKAHPEDCICDDCKEEAIDLYDYEGQYLCEECLLNAVPKIHHE